jgi:hypothetical protein
LLREPRDGDWDGYIKTVHITGTIIARSNVRYNFEFDNEWIKKEKGLKEGDTFKINGLNSEIIVVDEKNETNKSLRDFVDKLPTKQVEEHNKEYIEKYQNAYLVTSDNRIKINAMRITYDVILHTTESWIDAQTFIKAIIKDIENGLITFIKK